MRIAMLFCAVMCACGGNDPYVCDDPENPECCVTTTGDCWRATTCPDGGWHGLRIDVDTSTGGVMCSGDGETWAAGTSWRVGICPDGAGFYWLTKACFTAMP